MSQPIFMMMCGLPGSGKSTYAKTYKDTFKIFSSDEIRAELLGDETNQEENDIVFRELHRRIKECLANGENCIYDACNISYKRRMAFLGEIKKYNPHTICIFNWKPYEQCLIDNKKRDRVVPDYAIERMYKNIFIPQFFEGWDKIDIVQYGKPSTSLGNMFYGSYGNDGLISIPHDNHHHTLTIGQHILSTYLHAVKMTDDNDIHVAALLHDIGKPFTKDFKDSKGNPSEEAHYYQHHLVSAYMAVPYIVDDGFCDDFKNELEILALITFHMYPYFWEKDNNIKMMEKYKKLWGVDLFNKVMILHEADDLAH